MAASWRPLPIQPGWDTPWVAGKATRSSWDSFGFNDRTWLNDRGLPHTEALSMRERYQRQDFGHLRVDVTFTDPAAYTKPWSFTVNFALAADTEMLEAVCEGRSHLDHWVGKVSDVRKSARRVPQD